MPEFRAVTLINNSRIRISASRIPARTIQSCTTNLTEVMALDELDAADNVAAGNDVPESEIGERFELALYIGRERTGRRGVKY